MKKPSIIILVFLVTLGVIAASTTLAYRDLNTVSQKENRRLAQLPNLTKDSWFSGEFAKATENFLSDHTYNRSRFLEWSDFLEAKIEKGMEVKVVDQNVDLGQDSEAQEAMNQDVDLEEQDEPNPEEIEDTDKVDEEEKAQEEEQIILEDRIVISYVSNENTKDAYVKAIRSFFNLFPSINSKTLLLVPGRIAYESDWQEYAGDQRGDIKDVYQMMDSSINTVDIWDALAQRDVNDLYFRTDHHWTADAAYIGIKAYLECIGRECIPIESYKKKYGDPFLGYLYAQANAKELKNHKDELIYYVHPDGVNKETIFVKDKENPDNIIQEEALVLDADRQGYYTFVAGSLVYAIVDGRSQDGSCLLLLGDSYCFAMTPWLSDNFGKVLLVDPRNWSKGKASLMELCEQEGVTDILIADYAHILNNSWFVSKISDLTK